MPRLGLLLLVYPDDAGFFQLGVLLPEFAGNGAQRNRLRRRRLLREIRSRPFSLREGETRAGEDAPFMSHGRIRCVCRMTRGLVNLRLAANRSRHIAQRPRWCKVGRTETKSFSSQRLPIPVPQQARDHPPKAADVGSSRLNKSKPGTKLCRCEIAACGVVGAG